MNMSLNVNKWLTFVYLVIPFQPDIFSEMHSDERSRHDGHTVSTGGVSLPSSLSLYSCSCCFHTVRWWYLLLRISFVLITRINDWFGYLNASFRETWLPCHGYELQAGLCFTWGSLSSLFSPLISCMYTHMVCLMSNLQTLVSSWCRWHQFKEQWYTISRGHSDYL